MVSMTFKSYSAPFRTIALGVSTSLPRRTTVPAMSPSDGKSRSKPGPHRYTGSGILCFSRFSNLVMLAFHLSSTVPVGPLRCFATIISAMFFRSVSGL